MARRILIVLILAFVLNLIWEHLHSALYVSYQSGTITDLILFRAALFDAAVITIFSYPFFTFKRLKQRRWILYVGLLIFAVVLEKWALMSGRWVYADAMPIIPLLAVGLTPSVQLGVLGYLSVWVAER